MFLKFQNDRLVRPPASVNLDRVVVGNCTAMGNSNPDAANPDQHPPRLQGPCFPSLEEKKKSTTQSKTNKQKTYPFSSCFFHTENLTAFSSSKLLGKDQEKQWPIYMHYSNKRRNPKQSYETFHSQHSATAAKKHLQPQLY